MMKKSYISNNQNETNDIALEFAKELKRGDVVLLKGDLGAGKTAFVKGVVKALGGNFDEVTSPTFTIVNEYYLKDFPIFHFDLYRIENPDELFNIGYEEYIYGDGVCFFEWPERAIQIFDENVKVVEIHKLSETKREIVFEEKN